MDWSLKDEGPNSNLVPGGDGKRRSALTRQQSAPQSRQAAWLGRQWLLADMKLLEQDRVA
jgi:hypothetical protein